jgi:transposase
VGLAKLAAWLKSHGVTHVGMESTGVYWILVYAVLEQSREVRLSVANAQHVKPVPGRKTDVKDAEWLAQLVRFGLMPKSFVPPKPMHHRQSLRQQHESCVAPTRVPPLPSSPRRGEGLSACAPADFSIRFQSRNGTC